MAMMDKTIYTASAATTGHCDNCFNRHVTSDAVRWCPDCEEALCETCLQHHNASKLLKSHDTVTLVDNSKLPDFISELSTYCSEHDEKFELYCMRHQECCCPSCVKEKHHECTVYETIKNVVKGVKTSPAFEDVEHALGDVIKNFDAIIESRSANKARISKQSTVKLKEIKDMREIVNQHLDLIEQALVKQLSEEVDGLNSSLKEQVRNVSEKKAKAEEIKRQFENIKEYATEIQAFLCIKRFEDRVGEDLKYQNTIVKESTEVDLGVEFSDPIKSFKDVVFGRINTMQSVPTVELIARKKEQAQILMPLSKCVNSVQLSKRLTVSIPTRDKLAGLYGCTFLPCGTMAFCDFQNRAIIVCDGNGMHLNTISVQYKPFDITYLEHNNVAVTLKGDFKVGVFNLWTGCEVSSFKTSSECFGIEFQNNKFLIRQNGHFLETDLKGNVLRIIECKDCRSFLSLLGDSIFSTNQNNDNVICFDKNGRLNWKANDPILKVPVFITTDSVGFSYVCGKNSNNVVVVSPDGREFKEIISDISEPSGIFFDKISKKLLVCEISTGNAYVYDVSFG